jgi:hypothetical protein
MIWIVLETTSSRRKLPAAIKTLSSVSTCHRRLGENLSVALTIPDEHWALNSASDFSKNANSSFIIARMLDPLMSAKLNSSALLLMDTSGS